MTTVDLEALRAKAIADPRAEPAFFAAMLDARLFAHRPVSDDTGRVRLLQFTRPDGLTVLPVFTSRERAEFAAGGAGRVLEFVGRELFLVTRGAVIMVDPNDESCTLYPEEIDLLLRQASVPAVATFVAGDDEPYRIATKDAVSDRLTELLRQILSSLSYISGAYLFERVDQFGASPSYLLAIDVECGMAERAARAVAVGLQQLSFAEDAIVDILTYDKDLPAALQTLNAAPFYIRR